MILRGKTTVLSDEERVLLVAEHIARQMEFDILCDEYPGILEPLARKHFGHSIICPNCGAGLHVVAAGADQPPWLCPRCWRPYWSAQLTEEARAAVGEGLAITEVHRERVEASHRGCSLRSDQLIMAPPDLLDYVLAMEGVHPDFRRAVEEAR
jgi:hypothetical protein